MFLRSSYQKYDEVVRIIHHMSNEISLSNECSISADQVCLLIA